jgi:DNA polymerase-3 subunit alpha
MKFVSLHHHTTFSYQDGYGTPESHVQRVAEMGGTALAVTEHGNVSSHVRLEQAADEAGIKPVFGCELYCGEVGEGATRRKNHLTVLAENQEGYRNLLRVVSKGWSDGFYYEPTVSGPMLADHKDGLVVLSGCTGSLLATSLVGGKNIDPGEASLERGYQVARRFKASFGDAYYLEVQAFPELESTRNINRALAELADKLDIQLVGSLDAHYTEPGESEMQQILHNVRPGKNRTLEDQARAWSYDVKLCPKTDKEVYELLVHTGLTPLQARRAIHNAAEIAQRCTVKLPKIDVLRYPLPEGVDDPIVLFRQWCNDGWKFRHMASKPEIRDYEGRTYVERAKYEMGMIESKGFVDYFLVVSDAVRFAKDNGIPVGPARGSAAASLICYLLRITEVDPVLFPTLLFERFIDINRHDLPDIDLDFDDERRGEVRDYLVAKYGADRVGNIGTFVKYKGKNSLDDVRRVYRIPEYEVKAVKDLLIERASGDLRASATIEDTIEMFPQVKDIFDRYPQLYKATLLEGNIKGMSVHAAGLVIANEPLTNACAVYRRVDKDGTVHEVVSLDKYDAEYLNVLKLDALGLNTMAMIRIALEHIGMTLEELYELPLDDPETLRGFQENDVVGIFQFDGRAMRSVNQGVIPDNFIEVCDINALARPGPLHSGATAEYIDVKHGRKEPTHWHEIVDRITVHTNFQVVYQEQILQVVRDLGNFSWEEAARIRKIISKKRGEQEFNQQRDKFVEGALAHGMDTPEAHGVFNMLATAGAYAFNAAHCISYGMLAFWTMWLKRHHPQAFYVGALRKYDPKIKVPQLLRDADRHDIKIGKLHMNISGKSWTVDGSVIRPGFVQVPGIGEKIADALLADRELKGPYDGWKSVKIKGIGPAKLGYMQDFIADDDPFGLNYLRDSINRVKAAIANGDLTDGTYNLPTPTHTAVDVPYDRSSRDIEVVWLGVIKDINMKDLFEAHFSRTGEQLDPNTVKNPELNEWVVMLGEDDTDTLSITVDRWRYPRMKEQVWEIAKDHDIVVVRGLKKGFQARKAIYVTHMWVIDPESDEDIEEELEVV